MRRGEEKGRKGEFFNAPARPVSSSLPICVACGSAARRETANFCLVCGKSLDEDYQPLDAFRASYNLQGKAFAVEDRNETENLFEQNKNAISQTAWACLVYSFVPYLGILFVPFTVGIGGFAYVTALRYPDLGGRKLALTSIGLSFAVLAIQLFLWWLLYIIPELGRDI